MSINPEHYPEPNDQGTKSRIPHSGRHGYEQPVQEFDNTSLGEAHERGLILTPDSPAPLLTLDQEDKKTLGWRKPAAAGALVLVAVAGAFGIGKATSGGEANSQPETQPSATGAPAVPGETEPLIAQQRADMYYAYEPDYFISDEFYLNNPAPTEGGPGGYSDPSEYIDQTVVHDLVSDLLHNMTVATETGSEDAIIATYAQESDGNFGNMQDEVDVLRQQIELKQGFIGQYPDYPIGSIVLQSIDSVSPNTANKDHASIELTVQNTQYGNYNAGEEPVAFITTESWSWDLERREVNGFSASSGTTMWVITNASVNSSETTPS